MHSLQERLGLARSLVMYYGQFWRGRTLRRFYAQFIHPGDLCFDIGSHVGNRLRIWTALGACAVAVEPQPQCMRLLRRWYGDQPQITLVEAAAGAALGAQALWISTRTPTVSTLSASWMAAVRKAPSFAAVRWDTSVEVQVITLDSLIARFGAPAFCKIDVEGYELEVLRGLSQPLPALSFEYIPPAVDVALACIERLEEFCAYTYNWSLSEQHRWRSRRWLDGDAIRRILRYLPISASSGDVYARRTDQNLLRVDHDGIHETAINQI